MNAAPSVAVLALAELRMMGAPVEDFPATARNIAVAEALGQLRRDYDAEGRCTGFLAWMRLSLPQLVAVAENEVRIFGIEDNTPGAPVCFWLEQMNVAGTTAMHRRMRALSALPGVEVIAGWRGDRLRCHRVRHGRI